MPQIFVDADACPMKHEVYRVAMRYDLDVTLVANNWMRMPEEGRVRLEVVTGDFDAADNWIVEHVQSGDVVITADIPLASRCLEKGARVIGTAGDEFTPDGIGQALAMRELLAGLRSTGEMTGGPAPLTDRDRSMFLQKLDRVVQTLLR